MHSDAPRDSRNTGKPQNRTALPRELRKRLAKRFASIERVRAIIRQPPPTFRRNSTWTAECDGSRCVIKQFANRNGFDNESALLMLAAQSGTPVPPILWNEEELGVLVLGWCEGRTLWQELARGQHANVEAVDAVVELAVHLEEFYAREAETLLDYAPEASVSRIRRPASVQAEECREWMAEKASVLVRGSGLLISSRERASIHEELHLVASNISWDSWSPGFTEVAPWNILVRAGNAVLIDLEHGVCPGRPETRYLMLAMEPWMNAKRFDVSLAERGFVERWLCRLRSTCCTLLASVRPESLIAWAWFMWLTVLASVIRRAKVNNSPNTCYPSADGKMRRVSLGEAAYACLNVPLPGGALKRHIWSG